MGFWSKAILAVIIIGVMGGAGYFAKPLIFPELQKPAEGVEVAPRVFPTPAPGQALYQSMLYRFRLLYPQVMVVKEYSDGDGTTVVFEEPQSGAGFQIFIIPYSEAQITEERFKKDVPSGVMESPEDVLVDGMRARAFNSSDQLVGETREVWFLHNGFLYEVTTHRSLKEVLSNILATWQFI
jgi:hypothetical protein